MSSFITMLIGLAIGFSVARLETKGYPKMAVALFAMFTLSLLGYMGWSLYQIWVEHG